METSGTIFLLDDDASVLRALTRVLKAAGCDVEAYQSARAFLARPPCDGPACLVLDQHMPELSGLEVQRALQRTGGGLPIVFLTAHGDVATSVLAMKEGAFDFLVKPVEDDKLLDAVSRAVAHSAQTLEAGRERATFLERVSRLTPRERQVCVHVISGFLNKQIAWEMGVAEKTVKIHRARVMVKLSVGSVAELARLVERTGAWTELEPGSPSAEFAT